LRHYLILATAFACSLGPFACANGGLATTTEDSTGDPDGTAPSSPGADGGSGNQADSAGATDAAAGGDTAAPGDAAPACVDTDAGCVTGSPGACGAGTLHCAGGAAVCTPLATSQPCYSGAPATQRVGVCKDGTQTCTGTLGTCTGEVIPALVENCFNSDDDDCSGTVNNGCPIGLALGGDRPLGGIGGPGGGGPNPVHCPAGAFVTRVDSWFDNGDAHASGVSIFCATPSLVQGASSYSVTLTPNQPAPYATITGSKGPLSKRTDDCGIVGLTAITYTVGLADSFVEGLGAHCGTSAVTLKPDNTIAFNFVTQNDTSYDYFPPPVGSFFSSSCNPNEVVVGYTARTGSWMDNLQPICAALTVTYK
jgi:hypothetical protein